ncbi:TetR/AcrR family transcriptional regulator [Lentzea sp. HUAS12]|uniref:TetR/AcrR family transcriptional regulator n=1 Tax=Lentzea sp. HUAS12 TaxID=2951806 RepID=UPI00209CB621|nr:TetR/AcrR family transcriptional regulator [Lentzea sp. HUAS12]USX49976.1 TetR/AcrR family transcriptional regulator [Lentzea sp. HUAS12]
MTADNPVPKPMRERIVDVALDLFARQGYQGTSLRHIAERLGVSKAAVYHHFHAKDDIARVVVVRALDVLTEASDRLVVAGTDPGAWQRALPQIIDVVLRHRQMLVVLERNEDVFHALFANDADLGARMAQQNTKLSVLFADPRLEPRVRVRLGSTLGAIFGPLVMFSDHYQDMPTDQLRDQLMEVIKALLGDL